MYNSHSFFVEHAFFSIMFTRVRISLFTFLALCGHTFTQRMHEMHIFLSVFAGFSWSMAPTGHRDAHTPHLVQSLVMCGTIPTLPAVLYGLLPGIKGVVKFF